MIEIYDRTTRQFIPITPQLQPEYDAIMQCWGEDSGDPRELSAFLAAFCDVATGRIDDTVTTTDRNWAGLYMQYLDLEQRPCPTTY
jgi:hypothetical protein